MLPYRPILKLSLTSLDKALEVIAILILALLWLLSILKYSASPDIIPIHFKLNGEPDGYVNKAAIFFEAGIATFVYILLTVVNRYPHRMNFIVTLTEENALTQYKRMTKLLRWLKIFLLIFMLLVLELTGSNNSGFQGYTMVALTIIMVVAMPVFIVLYASKKEKKV